jgi:hypothetical protein
MYKIVSNTWEQAHLAGCHHLEMPPTLSLLGSWPGYLPRPLPNIMKMRKEGKTCALKDSSESWMADVTKNCKVLYFSKKECANLKE